MLVFELLASSSWSYPGNVHVTIWAQMGSVPQITGQSVICATVISSNLDMSCLESVHYIRIELHSNNLVVETLNTPQLNGFKCCCNQISLRGR